MFKEFLMNDSVKNQMLKKVYRLIHLNRQASKAELLAETNIKQTTLSRMLDELLKNQFIRESGYGKSSGGRPPVLYEINKESGYLIGIDISRIETKVILMNLHYEPIEASAFPMTKVETPHIVFSKLLDLIQQFLKNLNIGVDKILGIGVGTVGPIHREEGILLNPEGFLAPNWENVKIKDMLKQYFPVPIVIDNGANTAAIGEYTYHGSLYSNILYCISGYGVRCGVVSNGQLIHSKQGDASAYGHIIIRENGKTCTCGQKGCLTAYSSYRAMLEEFQSCVKISSFEEANTENLMDTFMSKLKADDPITREIVSKAAYYYGIGIANMTNVLHPELVVLHGSLVYESQEYVDQVVESALKHMYSHNKNSIQFKKGVLGKDAIAIGAGIRVFQSYFMNDLN